MNFPVLRRPAEIRSMVQSTADVFGGKLDILGEGMVISVHSYMGTWGGQNVPPPWPRGLPPP